MGRLSRAVDVESLETRRLLSAALASDGTLNVTATADADYIAVAFDSARNKIKVVEGDKVTLFPASSVTKVCVMLGTDSDTFNGVYADRPLLIDGEGGADTIAGGNRNDCLIGGLDNDSVTGGEGDDSLSGSGGKDFLDGGLGKDRLDGGVGNDILHGGAHNDRLIGGEGNDLCYGEGGDDIFYCSGIYSDTLFGASGVDRGYYDGNDVTYSVETHLADPV